MGHKAEPKSWALRASLHLQRILPSWISSPAWVTRLSSLDAERRNPRMVASFIRQYGIDSTRASLCSARDDIESCASRYGSLQAFFQRRERGLRIGSAKFVSPATGMVVAYPSFPESGVWVKGGLWSASRLLGRALSDDTYGVAIVRLRPADYHHFHAPFSGRVTSVRDLPGAYLSVDPLIVRSSKNPLTENHRVVYEVSLSKTTKAYVVAVGAAIIGSVVSYVRAGDSLRKGQDMGTFGFGGSTVVVLWPRGPRGSFGGAFLRPDVVRASARARETYVSVGEPLVV